MTLRDEFEKAMAPLLSIWCGMNSDPSTWHKRPDRSYLNGLLEQHFATYQAAHTAQQKRVEELEALLKVAACPANCVDGAYHDNYGEPVQCQFCYEREQALSATAREGGDEKV